MIQSIKISFLIVALLSLSIRTYAEPRDTNEIYIRTFHEFFYVKLLSAQKIFDIKFSSNNVEDSPQMIFKPNIGNYLGFGFMLFDLGVDVIFRTPPGPESNAMYGDSKGRDWQIHAYNRKFAFDLSYQQYKGFYLDNPSDFFPSWTPDDPHPTNPDMEARIISLAGLYVFKDDRYSFPSIFNQTEAQLKTAGSFFITGQANSSLVKDPVSIVITSDSNKVLDNVFLTDVNVSSINVMPGYSFNLVLWKKIYINASLALGFGYQFRNYTEDRVTYVNNSIAPASTWRAGLGYNSRRFFIGINGFLQNNSVDIDNLNIASTIGMTKFFIGYRFREYGIMQRSVFDLFNIFSRKKKRKDA